MLKKYIIEEHIKFLFSMSIYIHHYSTNIIFYQKQLTITYIYTYVIFNLTVLINCKLTDSC